MSHNVSLLELVAAYGNLFSITAREKLGKRNAQFTENQRLCLMHVVRSALVTTGT
jgi:hypothetical protein